MDLLIAATWLVAAFAFLVWVLRSVIAAQAAAEASITVRAARYSVE